MNKRKILDIKMNNLPKIILLSGSKRSGKDTFANYLEEHYGYKHIKITTKLKNCIKMLFDLEDEDLEIAYSDAIKIEPDFEVGEEVSEQIQIKDFGRRQVLALRQTLVSRIMDLEKKEIFDRYEDRVGEIVNGEVYQVWRNEILILDGEENELILPKSN